MTNQDSPIQDGHDDAELEQKLAGLVAQAKADLRLGTSTDAAAGLQQRLLDAGIELDRADFDALLARVVD